jgi:secondary thiamine-phosphate synthase enzyme
MAASDSSVSPTRLQLRTTKRVELRPITSEVRAAVRQSGVRDGLCVVYVPHTTAGVTINENADPDVVMDLETIMGRLVPADGGYLPGEGNSDAHMKTAMAGTSATMIVQNGDLLLGTWQGVFFCEFDGPRTRSCYIKTVDG